MRSGVVTIMKKELARFFGDRRLLVSILMPGVLIYVLYSFMGTAMGSMFGVDEDYVPSIRAAALPVSVEAVARGAEVPVVPVEPSEVDSAKKAVTDQELDLLLVFPEDFDAAVAAYQPGSGAAPNVAVYFNSASTQSQSAYRTVTALLDAYESQLANKFDVNAGGAGGDLATQEDAAGSYFAMLMPMLPMMFLYSGCSAVAPESIAGEKERGTIATLLVTPMKRSSLALGKVFSLSLIHI